MKLFYHSTASSGAVHMILRELDVPFELEDVSFQTHITETGADYMKINPKGYVPALELDDGAILTEAAAVLQYLGDRYPESGLVPPAGSMERYRLIEWIHFFGCEIGKKCLGPMWNPKLADSTRQYCLDQTKKKLDYLAGQLADRQYLMGDRFTVADAYAFSLLAWCDRLDVPLADWPAVFEYRARIAGRPTAQKVMEVEGWTIAV